MFEGLQPGWNVYSPPSPRPISCYYYWSLCLSHFFCLLCSLLLKCCSVPLTRANLLEFLFHLYHLVLIVLFRQALSSLWWYLDSSLLEVCVFPSSKDACLCCYFIWSFVYFSPQFLNCRKSFVVISLLNFSLFLDDVSVFEATLDLKISRLLSIFVNVSLFIRSSLAEYCARSGVL